MLEKIEITYLIIGGLVSVIMFIWKQGKSWGKSTAKDSVDTQKIAEIESDTEKLREKFEELKDTVKDLLHKGELTEQTLKVLQGQIEVLFKLNEKHGEKMEKFFDQMLELSKEK
tara:strand:+ start:7830 stop:8171 length:342 start_codon:yes stop_codon:yes gene_type:complete